MAYLIISKYVNGPNYAHKAAKRAKSICKKRRDFCNFCTADLFAIYMLGSAKTNKRQK